MRTIMKANRCMHLLALIFLGSIYENLAQQPVASLGQNGVLVCTNLIPGSTATIQWASSLQGSWNNLFSVTVGTNGTIATGVPMFYRVLGVPVRAGMVLIPAG